MKYRIESNIELGKFADLIQNEDTFFEIITSDVEDDRILIKNVVTNIIIEEFILNSNQYKNKMK